MFHHWHEISVRWGDMDALRHLNNAKYFTFLESARLSYLADLGYGRILEAGAHGPVLVNISCNFRREVIHPAQLSVGTRISRMSSRSFGMEQHIFNTDGQVLVADSTSVMAWVDYEARRSGRLPDSFRRAVEEFQKGTTTENS